MNFEASRLRTFRNWPANAVVDARRIAKAGFYYMGQGLEVQCFSCGGRIAEWNYGDKVMTRHRWLDPRCPFVVNPASSGNVPVEVIVGNNSNASSTALTVNDATDATYSPPTSPQPVSQLSQSPPPPVRRTNSVLAISRRLRTIYQHNELARLNSFEDWPKPYIVTPESLARAGFYYTRDSDTVKCAFCDLMVGHWEEGDDPYSEHLRHFPDCSFLNRSVQPSSNTTPEPVDFPPAGVNLRTPPNDGEQVSVRDLGVQYHKVPKHPKYSMQEARLQTFINWPGDVVQLPEDLAAAGFYYAGSGDQVKCFHCNGGLRMWDPQDDPWIEHARWYPQCGYIIVVKGQSFVDQVLRDYPPLDAEELSQIERVNVTKENENVLNSAHPPRPHVPISESQLQELMMSPEAVAALQVGLEVSRVKIALRQRAEIGGLPFHSPEALINAALDVQLEEAPEHEHSEAWGTPPSSPVTLWPRRRHMSFMTRQARSENTSEGNTTENEDSADYPRRKSVNHCAVPVVSTTDEEGDNGSEINNEPATLEVPTGGGDDSGKNHLPQLPQEEVKQNVSLEEENRRLKEARLCKICMDKEISIVFLPCGHLVTCVHCAHSLADCPVCRKEIKATVRTFLS